MKKILLVIGLILFIIIKIITIYHGNDTMVMGNYVDIMNMINDNDAFNRKIKYLVELKYPKFIADELNKESTLKKYILNEDKLLVNFSNYNIDDRISDVSLNVNYNEISGYININFPLNEDYENEDGFMYDKNKKTIAFTFDDGPSGVKTLELIKTLNDNKAHATFFMLGKKMEEEKGIVYQVYKSKNEIGYHSYDHKNMSREDINKIKRDYELTNNIYKDITNETLKYIRPPYGILNDDIKNNISLPYILWSLDTNDWQHRNSEYLYNYVLNYIKDGDIVLFHDSYESTIETIKKLLPELYILGYQVVSVGELANLKGSTIINNEVYHKF